VAAEPTLPLTVATRQLEEVPAPAVNPDPVPRRVRPAPAPEPSAFTRPWFIGLVAGLVVIVGG